MQGIIKYRWITEDEFNISQAMCTGDHKKFICECYSREKKIPFVVIDGKEKGILRKDSTFIKLGKVYHFTAYDYSAVIYNTEKTCEVQSSCPMGRCKSFRRDESIEKPKDKRNECVFCIYTPIILRTFMIHCPTCKQNH